MQTNMGAFIVKGAEDSVYMHKFLHPMALKNDYMNSKDYNLMKPVSKCLHTYEFHQNEFFPISICFIGHKMYSKEWILGCVHGVKILNFLLSYIKPNH
jgi:hypothetical protein